MSLNQLHTKDEHHNHYQIFTYVDHTELTKQQSDRTIIRNVTSRMLSPLLKQSPQLAWNIFDAEAPVNTFCDHILHRHWLMLDGKQTHTHTHPSDKRRYNFHQRHLTATGQWACWVSEVKRENGQLPTAGKPCGWSEVKWSEGPVAAHTDRQPYPRARSTRLQRTTRKCEGR